jgi:hypothetical protein
MPGKILLRHPKRNNRQVETRFIEPKPHSDNHVSYDVAPTPVQNKRAVLVAYTSKTARVTFEVFVLAGIFCSSLGHVNEKPSGTELRPSSYLRRVSNGVSQIANSLDQLHLVISIHFLSQLVDGDVDQIVVRFIVGTPNRMNERVSGNDLARAPHQGFQQSKLCLAQGNLLACSRSIVRGRVQDQIAHP